MFETTHQIQPLSIRRSNICDQNKLWHSLGVYPNYPNLWMAYRVFNHFMAIPWYIMAGWWYTYPSEKYESQLGLWNSQLNGKITNVPNHQPEMVYKFSYTKLYPWKTIPTASQNVALTLLSIPWMGMGIPLGGDHGFFGYNGRYNEFNESHKHVWKKMYLKICEHQIHQFQLHCFTLFITLPY